MQLLAVGTFLSYSGETYSIGREMISTPQVLSKVNTYTSLYSPYFSLTVTVVNLSSVDQPVTVTIKKQSLFGGFTPSAGGGIFTTPLSFPTRPATPNTTGTFYADPSGWVSGTHKVTTEPSLSFTLKPKGDFNDDDQHTFSFQNTCDWTTTNMGCTTTYTPNCPGSFGTSLKTTSSIEFSASLTYYYTVEIKVAEDLGAVLASAKGSGYFCSYGGGGSSDLIYHMNGGRPF